MRINSKKIYKACITNKIFSEEEKPSIKSESLRLASGKQLSLGTARKMLFEYPEESRLKTIRIIASTLRMKITDIVIDIQWTAKEE